MQAEYPMIINFLNLMFYKKPNFCIEKQKGPVPINYKEQALCYTLYKTKFTQLNILKLHKILYSVYISVKPIMC